MAVSPDPHQAREKTIADQFEARRAKNKATRERKIGRREDRFAQVRRAPWTGFAFTFLALIEPRPQSSAVLCMGCSGEIVKKHGLINFLLYGIAGRGRGEEIGERGGERQRSAASLDARLRTFLAAFVAYVGCSRVVRSARSLRHLFAVATRVGRPRLCGGTPDRIHLLTTGH